MTTQASYKLFALLCATCVLVWRNALVATLALALRNEGYTHILVILPVSAMLLVMAWRNAAWTPSPSLRPGAAVLSVAAVIGLCGLTWGRGGFATGDWRLAINMLAVVVWLFGSVIISFGIETFRRGLFPLLFLLWLVPLPESLSTHVIETLQHGTASAVRLMFTAIGVPVTQNGMKLTAAGLTVEVAKECSSIRSSMVLVITCMAMSYVLLRSLWGRTIIVLAAIPLAIAKNGLRVFTLAALGAYVDPAILNGPLHREGGIIFFVIALAGMFGLIYFVASLERRYKKPLSRTQHPKLSTASVK